MALGWSLNFIIGKIALHEFPALLLSCLRTSLAGLLMLPALLSAPNRPGAATARSGLPLVMLGVLGVVCNQVLFVLGLSRTSVAHASILVCTAPVMVLLISAAAGHERITAKKLAGLAIAVVGVTILQKARNHGTRRDPSGRRAGRLQFPRVFAVYGARKAVHAGLRHGHGEHLRIRHAARCFCFR